ncbi:hypothetical protein GGS20DRAFT_299056 [Poronia punctata]|nr:hypothetical protein GGS20DRAFT_299056 [Poronia punctata]
MFSSSSATTSNFKGLRRKAANEGNSSPWLTARPSTATTDQYNYGVTGRLEPALDGPPSPEGIRAFGRRMKRGTSSDRQNELRTSSGSSSRAGTRESSTERQPETPGLSRNPSQRSSAMPFKERPESVQLFGKAVFSRKAKLRKEHSDQGIPNSSLLSLSHMTRGAGSEQTGEQRSIQSMFTRRRPRGTSETTHKRFQISGPYDFQHVAHSAKESLSSLEQVDQAGLSPDLARNRSRTTTDTNNPTAGLTMQDLDKPLPTPPTSQELERSSSEESIQFSPRRPRRPTIDESPMSPIPPPPRTSSRMSVRNDSVDSFGTLSYDRPATGLGLRQVQPFILPSSDGPRPRPIDSTNDLVEEDEVGSDGESSHTVSATGVSTWPLTGSMTSLSEVPEEEEYHLTHTNTRASVMSTTISLRGSISVPHLRRISLRQATQRPPSNASDTLGRFDLLTAQRTIHEPDEDDISADHCFRHSWEDDIDYCYDHAAEADCDFAWERPSCDLDRDEDEDYAESLILGTDVPSSTSSFRGLSTSLLTADLPGLSPTSPGSYQSKSPQYETVTPTSSTMPVAANFSLPRTDSSTKLKRDHDRSHSSASSFHESQGFSLSPSLLIPDDYHEQMLRYERGELSSHNSSDDLKAGHHEDQYLKFKKPDAFRLRSSASTTGSTLSEMSTASSRYTSSTVSSAAHTRWTGSSSSSWQPVEVSQPPVAITLNDKEAIVTPTTDVSVMRPTEQPVLSPAQESSREGHSRAHSDATLLMKTPHGAKTLVDSKAVKEPLKTHRRARTASRSHAATSPQFVLFPQVPQRF